MDDYSENYFIGGKSKGISGYEDYSKVENKIRNIIFPKILDYIYIKSKMKILDVGCAFGFLLKCFEEYGCRTYGVDVSEYAIRQAKKNCEANLLVHNVDQGLPYEDNFFDLIIMMDIIEHLNSPYCVLKECYRVLKPNGRIIITTPNLNCIGRYILKILGRENEWYGFYDKTHLYLFTSISLKFLIERVGFKVVKLECPFSFFLKANSGILKVLGNLLNKLGLGGALWLIGEK